MAEPRFITAAEVEGQVIPSGGTTDQALVKNSDADFDLKWKTGGGGGGIGGSIADQQIAFGVGTDIGGSDDFKINDAEHAIVLFEDNQGSTAQSGDMRLPNTFEFKARNSGDDGDVNVLSLNSKRIRLGDTDSGDPYIEFQQSGAIQIKTATLGGDFNINNGNGDVYIDVSSGVGHNINLYVNGGGAVIINDVLKLNPIADPPGSPAEGMIYADTDHHLYYYNGTDWKQLDN